ncbi:uncharacterized protein PRCAT00000791001 [Priceomyces carsonii]|uniref:uncharacterized protein n=1 Tax=Priceomyces carsonii TaxID=28549 RepID=UPI002ED9A5E0|nr:unnamed protein product [Priceomyces carsonii]
MLKVVASLVITVKMFFMNKTNDFQHGYHVTNLYIVFILNLEEKNCDFCGSNTGPSD